MTEAERRERALALFQQAYAHQVRKELEEAIRLYQESLSLCPTAEAHTFLGWAYSFQGRLDEAIAAEAVAALVEIEPVAVRRSQAACPVDPRAAAGPPRTTPRCPGPAAQ